MKELSIEEKAKAYDKVIEKANALYKVAEPMSGCNVILETLFPELKESEDERIRKNIITYLKQRKDRSSSIPAAIGSWIAWLEKQGSESNWCHHKVDLSNCSEEYRKAYYDGWNNCNMQHSQCKSELDDVLKCLINGMKFYYEDNKDATWGTDKWSMPVKHIIEVLERQGEKPADKVEPKFKVKYAGSEYNVLEVKDIAGVTYYGIEDEPNHIDYVQAENCERVGGYSIKENGFSVPTKPIMFSEKKPKRIVSADAKEAMYDKPAWSEDDETVLNNLIYALANDRIGNDRDEYINFLKSLKERYTWKPSDEQMKALHDLNLTGNISYAGQGQVLIELYNDLKKLREE